MDNIWRYTVIWHLRLKGSPMKDPKDMIATRGDVAPLYSLVKKCAAEFKLAEAERT